MVIHWELCKKLKFVHTNKWYVYDSESVLENKMHKVLWDFEIESDHLISARRPYLVIVNKKKKRTCQIVNFDTPPDHRVKLKESEKRDKYQDLARRQRNLWNMKVTMTLIVIGALRTIHKVLVKELKDFEIRK